MIPVRPATPVAPPLPPPLPVSLDLLERAVGVARSSLQGVTPDLLTRPTPCPRFTLQDLLDHMADSLDTVIEAADLGAVGLVAFPPSGVATVDRLRGRACALLGAWSPLVRDHRVAIGEHALTASYVALAGALEIAVHAWDVSQATGVRAPLPLPLAADLLPLVDTVVSEADRPERFAPALDVPMGDASDRLLARLGRRRLSGV